MTDHAPRRLRGRSYAETRSAVLDLIRSSETVSRTELSLRSSLTEVTIAKIVKELLSEGVIIEAGRGQSTGGKRPTLFRLNTGVLYSVGVSLDSARVVIALCGLNGKLIERVDLPGHGSEPPPDVMTRVAKSIQQLLARRGLTRDSVVGVGVASTGRRRGSLGWGAYEEMKDVWEAFDIAAELRSRCGLVVIVENDANCVALGAFWAGGNDAPRDFVTVYMSTGIGAGIVIAGAIFRGASDNAGEIGHIVVEPAGLECWCGSRGCLETVGPPKGIVLQVRADPELFALFDGGEARDEAAVYARVLKGLADGVPQAEALIDLSARRVATALLGVVNALDLDLIQLTGPGFAPAGERYRAELQTAVDRAAFSRRVHPVAVQLGRTGPDVAAMGAASVVFHSSLTPHHLSNRM
jgi:predicted NBD/HSP70 family sugar kinase